MSIINNVSAKFNTGRNTIFVLVRHRYFFEAIGTIVLSIPIIIGELIQMMVSIFGSAIAGRLSYQSLAAVSLVNGIINIPFILGVGITLALLQSITVACGQKNEGKMVRYLFNSLFIIFTMTAFFAVIIFLLAPQLFLFKQDQQVTLLAIPYLIISGIVLIPLLLYLSLKHFLDGQGATRITLVFSLISIPVNLFLLSALGMGQFGFPKFSLNGLALASVITNCVLLCSISIFLVSSRKYFSLFNLNRNEFRLHIPTINELLKNGIPISVQLGIEISAFAVASLFAGQLGSQQQAAHQIVFTCITFLLMVALGLGQGNAIKIGTAIGQNKISKIATISNTSIITITVYTFICGIALFFCQKQIPLLFNSNPDVLKKVYSLLGSAFLFLLLNNIQVILSSSLRGISDLKYPTLYVFIGYWLIGLPVGYFFKITGFDILGIWFGLGIGLCFTVFCLYFRFKKKVKLLSESTQ